jgi:hypothetical protein
VASVHISIQLFKCRLFHHWGADRFYPQPKIRGHIVSYSVDPQTILTDLPLSIDKLNGVIKVIFVSRKQVKFADVRSVRFFVVRCDRVYTALQWLIQHNPLYRSISINYENLGRLPIDGMIPEMFEQSMQTMNTVADDATHSRYDRPDAREAELNSEDSNSDSNSEDVVIGNMKSGLSNVQTGNGPCTGLFLIYIKRPTPPHWKLIYSVGQSWRLKATQCPARRNSTKLSIPSISHTNQANCQYFQPSFHLICIRNLLGSYPILMPATSQISGR